METVFSQLSGVLWKTSLQAGILAAVVWVVCRAAKKAPASFRCALWVLVLIKLFVPPFVDLPAGWAFWSHAREIAPVAIESTLVRNLPVARMEPAPAPVMSGIEPARPGNVVESTAVSPLRMPNVREIVLLLWAAGVCGFGIRLLVRMRRRRGLLVGDSVADESLMGLLEEAASSLRIDRLPRLRVSEAICTPTLVGFVRPTIVLPPQVVKSCGPEETHAMLLHELAHIRRRDMLALWLYEVARVVFFFHPAVWLAGREMEVEREMACDELVVRTSSISAAEYAAGYVTALRLARQDTAARMSLGMAEPFEVGKRRLERILRNDIPGCRPGG